jgi:hypothetical protein
MSFQSHRHACERFCPPRPCRSNSYSNVDFTVEVRWVQIDLGDAADDEDHLLSPEEQYRIAMARP